MNKARKFVMLMVAVVTVLMMAQGAFVAKAEKVTITWFVGLGTGAQKDQIDRENAVVAKFNETHPDIELKINIAASNQAAIATLGTLIGGGDAPDVVGPQGVSGANSFEGEWLDLTPLIEQAKFDLTPYPQNLVDSYRDGKALLGIPWAIYPGVLYYNADLFDDAGLAYPPAKFGEKYKLDGKEVDWSYDTVTEVAKRLTVDSAGNDATSDKFDPTKIVQWGFNDQWGTIRNDWHTFGAAELVKDGKVQITDAWKARTQWIWDGLWKSHFIPTASEDASQLLNGNAFSSGKIGMSRTMLWYTCCLTDLKSKWDLGVQPSYKGEVYAPIDLDNFRIDKNTKHPAEAFTVLAYLYNEAAIDLLNTYGAYPARPDLQKASIEAKAKLYPSVKNWDVVEASITKAPTPHHEAGYPNYNKGQIRLGDFRTLIYGDTGKDLDVNKELDKLQSDLQALVDQAAKK